jgi:hypothetical protein
MQIKKDREVNFDIWRQDRQYIIDELLVLCGDILRFMRFALMSCWMLPRLCNDQQNFPL